MEARPDRPSNARDLRALSTGDLISLIQQDIRELDQLIRTRRGPVVERKPPRPRATHAPRAVAAVPPPVQVTLPAVEVAAAPPPAEVAAAPPPAEVAAAPPPAVVNQPKAQPATDELEPLPLITVTCCGHKLGDFPVTARVFCPRCHKWLRVRTFASQ